MSHLLTLHYLPCIAWFQRIANEPDFMLEKLDNYNKQTFRNRCKILAANGVLDLIVPVKKNNTSDLYIDLELENDFNWKKQHWQSIQSAYGKSAFFEFYEDRFSKLYLQTQHSNLYAFNLDLVQLLLRSLKLDSKIGFSTAYEINPENAIDLRTSFSPKNKNSETELLKPIAYWQVFEDKFGKTHNLSIIDLLFNAGPESLAILRK
jgi:hypothetical protein